MIVSQARIVDRINEIGQLNEIRSRLANEFEPLHELNLYLCIVDIIDERIDCIINELKKNVRQEK